MMSWLKKWLKLIGKSMLNSGFKVVLEVSGDSVRAELTVNLLGRVVNVGVDLKSWGRSVTKKPYSVKVMVGPLMLSLIHLEKMNSYFNSLLKNKDGQDYSSAENIEY